LAEARASLRPAGEVRGHPRRVHGTDPGALAPRGEGLVTISSLPPEPPPLAPPDRTPTLAELVRADDLERCFRPFLMGAVDGIVLFDREGVPFAGASEDEAPLRRWEQLPPEAVEASRRGPGASFGLLDHVFDVR